MDEETPPYAQLELVQHVDNEHQEEVETKMVQTARECILPGKNRSQYQRNI